MATLTVDTIVRGSGLLRSTTAASAGGDEFVNDGRVFVAIQNTHIAASRTITFESPKTVDGLAVDELAVAVVQLTTRFIGPFPKGTFNDANGKVQMTYSTEADLNIQVLTY